MEVFDKHTFVQVDNDTLEKNAEEFAEFWKDLRYFVHKTDSYPNNKRKIAKFASGYLFMYVPVKNHPFYSLKTSPGKEMNEETLDKYWKEISRTDFFTLEELHVVT
jgi:hypothetical protein